MTKIGYLGLGAMGGALSSHLAKVFDLTVFDRDPKAMAALVSHGAKATSSPFELAQSCDILILCLPRTSDVQDVLFGQGRMAEGLVSGKMVIDQTSGIPSETNAISQRLAEQGVSMLDAPLSGGIPAAQNGTVTIIASGSDPDWTRAEPVLSAMTNKVFRCSQRVGDAQALKLVNNAIGAGYRMATLELAALATKSGVPFEKVVDKLNNGPAANFTSRNMLAGYLAGRETTNFALSLMIKDLNEALRLGEVSSSPMPMTAGAHGIMQIGQNLFGKNARLEDVIALSEQLAGTKLLETSPMSDMIDATLAAIEIGTLACNVLAIIECVAVGQNFGLSMKEMARILTVGSASSLAANNVLPALAEGRVPNLGLSLGQTSETLTRLSQMAAAQGTPLLMPMITQGYIQSAVRHFGKKADLGNLVKSFGLVQ